MFCPPNWTRLSRSACATGHSAVYDGQITTSTISSRSPAIASKSRTKARLSATVIAIFQFESASGLRIIIPSIPRLQVNPIWHLIPSRRRIEQRSQMPHAQRLRPISSPRPMRTHHHVVQFVKRVD